MDAKPNRSHLPGLKFARDAFAYNRNGVAVSAPTLALSNMIEEAEQSAEGDTISELRSLAEDLRDAGASSPDSVEPDDIAAVQYGLSLALELIESRIRLLEKTPSRGGQQC